MGITHLPYPQMFGTIDDSIVEPKAQAAFPLAGKPRMGGCVTNSYEEI